ncbi:hypothetical protein [Streptomyces sp. NPDC058335]|uniref:hypothetical protein n=1 Tax=Streptomyces sp. NPDC058335 TaxID=3346451 RepID=UPI003649A00F
MRRTVVGAHASPPGRPTGRRPPRPRTSEVPWISFGCQKQGRRVDVSPYVTDWWACLRLYGGCITNIHVRSLDNESTGVTSG